MSLSPWEIREQHRNNPIIPEAAKVWIDRMSDEDLDLTNPHVIYEVVRYEQRVQRIAELTDLPVASVRAALAGIDRCSGAQGSMTTAQAMQWFAQRAVAQDALKNEPWRQP